MSILKKKGPKEQSSGHPEAAQKHVRTRIKAELNKASGRTFGEDFNLEHSSSLLTSSLITFSANSQTMDQQIPRNSYSQDFRSPSCVYLG